jgi:hypothetical protein
MTVFSKIKPMWIIHLFALLHAVVALSCRLGGIEDELLLTLLTMTMVLLLCFKKNLNIEFTAAVIIISNILGYLFGTAGASILDQFISTPFVAHTVSTAVTTEILGWCILGIFKLFPKMQSGSDNEFTVSSLKWTLLAAGGIFILRLAIIFIYSHHSIEAGMVFEMTSKIFSNSVSIILLICLNLLYIRNLSKRFASLSKPIRMMIGCLVMIACSLLETIIAGTGFPFKTGSDGLCDFNLLFPAALLTQITIYCLVFVINFAISAKIAMRQEREKANMAHYRYIKLKGQVNPHFLFNSLNILDCLVCEEKNEQASTYIHKLAGIYRYMIKSEDEDVVPLRDELTFVEQYVDLLKLRFPEGFEVHMDAPEEMMSRYVLPCSIQLLIENATKHNAVSADNPLVIKIKIAEGIVRVSNNIIPKVTRSESTGLGQKYISQQYMDISGKAVEISDENGEYCVTLPLL